MKTTVLRVSKSFAFLGFPDSSVGKKIHLKCRRPWFDSWVRKIRWRRDRLPSPVFLGFPYGSAGKESTCNVVDLGSVPGLGRSPGEGKDYLPTPVFWPGEFYGLYSPWSRKEPDQLSLSESTSILPLYAWKAAHFSIFIWPLANLT